MPRAIASSSPLLRIRLILGDGRALGPGKADLLDAIVVTGSIAAAGRAMSMSYKRAWQLVDDLNRSFKAPLVSTSKGGGRGGGAELTAVGRDVLAAYRAIERKAQQSAAAELKTLDRLVERK
ncbi:MAG TPA: LysR family transcriptional regulator [Rudaea sp.]